MVEGLSRSDSLSVGSGSVEDDSMARVCRDCGALAVWSEYADLERGVERLAGVVVFITLCNSSIRLCSWESLVISPAANQVKQY